MGQRAITAIKNGTTATITTVQWATCSPLVYREAIKGIMEHDKVDFATAARFLFEDVIQYEHISAVSIFEDAEWEAYEYKQDNDIVRSITISGEPHKLVISVAWEGEVQRVNLGGYDSFAHAVQSHEHAQDGFSMMFDMDNPAVVQAWIDPEYGEHSDDLEPGFLLVFRETVINAQGFAEPIDEGNINNKP